MIQIPRDRLTPLIAIARTIKRCVPLFVRMNKQVELNSNQKFAPCKPSKCFELAEATFAAGD
jgi:hypothetical protein